MATINVNIDLSAFEGEITNLIEKIGDPERLMRPVCVELVGIMTKRIHEDGVASDGSKIGTYKTSYLRIREKFKHGKDTDVILVLSRKLSNSWGAFATEKGYSVGFVDSGEGVTSLKKIQFAEEHFSKKIGELSEEESKYAEERFIEIVNEIINGRG